MPHPDRREFLALLAAGSGALSWPSRGRRDGPLLSAAPAASAAPPAVTAEATPFFAHPEGERCLVRFFVSQLDAPAGRMRAFDRSGRLLGTAGVITLGDGRLYGELWLPTGALPRIRTELEAPGLRRPLATWHALALAPRWVLHWITLLDPERLYHHLTSLDRIPRAVEIAALQRSGAMISPVPASIPLVIGDVPFLRLAESGERATAFTGIAPGPAVIERAAFRAPGLPTVLSASGVTTVVLKNAPAAGLHRLTGAEAARLLVAAVPADAAPEHLGFLEGGDRMVRSVELLLAGMRTSGGDTEGPEGTGPIGRAPERSTIVLGTELNDLARALGSVRDWNARFAYPRIEVGDATGVLRAAPHGHANGESPWVPQPPLELPVPTPEETMDYARRRVAESRRRAEAMIACLARLVPGAGADLEGIASQMAMPVRGTLVFNPTSFARTDLVPMADGSERVATDIPPLGYAYFPQGTGDGGRWRAMEDDGGRHSIETRQFRLALDPDTGAIRSLETTENGREWADQILGLNAVDGARLEGTTRETLPGVGVRIMARRRGTWGGEIRTVITLYEQLSWIDVENQVEAGRDQPVAYRFGFGLEVAAVEWEVPAGAERATPPCDCAHLRWVRFLGEHGSAFLAARHSAVGRVAADGAFTSYAPDGECRYRIGVMPPDRFVFREDPWRFGWGIEPAVTAPVSGTGRARLPTFGSLLVVDQLGVAVVAMQPAADGNGIIVYLQELGGLSRVATLGAGLIGFEDARQVDLVERDLGAPAMVMRNGLGVLLPAHGVAAVRLLGVKLAGA